MVPENIHKYTPKQRVVGNSQEEGSLRPNFQGKGSNQRKKTSVGEKNLDVTKPSDNKPISPIPWHVVKSMFHCSQVMSVNLVEGRLMKEAERIS